MKEIPRLRRRSPVRRPCTTRATTASASIHRPEKGARNETRSGSPVKTAPIASMRAPSSERSAMVRPTRRKSRIRTSWQGMRTEKRGERDLRGRGASVAGTVAIMGGRILGYTSRGPSSPLPPRGACGSTRACCARRTKKARGAPYEEGAPPRGARALGIPRADGKQRGYSRRPVPACALPRSFAEP